MKQELAKKHIDKLTLLVNLRLYMCNNLIWIIDAGLELLQVLVFLFYISKMTKR